MARNKALNDYNQQIATRLSRLAAIGSTGALPVSGYSSGAIYLLDGRVVGAESSRTPRAAGAARAVGPAGPGGPAGPAGADLSRVVMIAESAVDAALDLLSSRSTCSRFRPAKTPPDSKTISVSVADLLTEVTRRRRLLEQMSGITADLALVRIPELRADRVQLTAAEWALLIRVRPRSTPRELAWTLRRSVFGTTVDVHRLILLGLLRSADRPVQVPIQAPGQKPARRIKTLRPTPSNSKTQPRATAAASATTAASATAPPGSAGPSGQAAHSSLTALSFGQAVPAGIGWHAENGGLATAAKNALAGDR
jgi:hypothetical protein